MNTPPSASGLAFEEATHAYTLDGLTLPSVTQIMRPMSLMLYETIPTSTLDDAADRGTRAHEAVSNIVKYGIREDDDDTTGYIDAYERFVADRRPAWLESEFRSYHKNLLYAGTLDLVGFVEPDDGTGVDVVDIKTTRVVHMMMLSTQVSAYAEIIKSHGAQVRSLYGLHLKHDGKYGLYKLDNGFQTFLACKMVVDAMAREKRA